MSRRVIPVILSGGSGTRLWPMSRKDRPKQLLGLMGERTMLQMTALRCPEDERFAPPIVVAGASYAAEIDEQMKAVGATPSLLVLEPVARNTAPAIALAALLALEKDEDAVLLIMPSDHVIENVPAFHAAIEQALPSADEGWLVTFGITPTGPETGYGYICAADEVAPGVCEVERFVEKPDAETAAGYVASGNYAWNAGIFLMRADSFLAALANNAADIAIAVRKSIDAAGRRGRLLYPEPKSFAQSPAQSVDYAVMEKSPSVATIPVDMGWSDVGSWDALYALAPKDGAGNALRGEVLTFESEGCLVQSNGPTVSVDGLKDVIVIATADAVLVMPRGRSQDVRRTVDELKARDSKKL